MNREKEIFVTKRNGSQEKLDPEKIKERLSAFINDLNTEYLDLDIVVAKVMQGIYNGVTTEILDNLAAETCAYMNIVHPDYSKLAARIVVSNLHKKTLDDFYEVCLNLYEYKDSNGRNAPLVSERLLNVVKENRERIQKAINYQRDFKFDYFGLKTLEKSYLLKLYGKIFERPQHLLMRVSLGIHFEKIDLALETYELMSNFWFIHASPTLFNSGTPKPQMSSCFLLQMLDDSIDGIYETLTLTAKISKSAGGIGFSIHNIRAKDSYIRGTNGISNGIVPMLRVFNDTARYVDQGGGKRKGAFAVYLEPWHADIFEFLNLRKNHGKEEQRARDLFYALWTPDLFMKRVQNKENWTLMCPNECPGLSDCYGDEFEKLYNQYETEGKGKKTINAQQLWAAIIESQIETGTPYMLYKDHANIKSNQKNLGTIKCSNLCTEIMEYTSPDEVAVCNLASISLPKFIKEDKTFDFDSLIKVTRVITKNLNNIIDLNHYPVEQAKTSNLRHRPIGIGVQGFADALMKMKICFESEECSKINKQIFETIYWAALNESLDIAKIEGPYETFIGSPTSQGILQYDMWNVKPTMKYDWEGLKQEIQKYGLRNSLLIAPMPTASTSQILGNNESFEPFTTNIYTRRVLAGEFVLVNPHLVRDLIELNLWTSTIKTQLIAYNGSVQSIKEIPDNIKSLYKTVWEIKQRKIIELAAERAPFIDQSQSLNIHLSDPNLSKISSMHFFAWQNGLKTGMYYLRTRPAVDAIKFTLNVEELLKATDGHDVNRVLKCLNTQNNDSLQKQISFSAEKNTQIIPNNNEDQTSCFGCG